MGGGSVDQGAVQQEQANQNQAQQYAAQQQAAAQKQVNDWLAQNKAPVQGAAALQAPTASSPATVGGGTVAPTQSANKAPVQQPGASAQPQRPAAQATAQPQQVQNAGQAMTSPTLTPQMKQMIIAQLSGQKT
jgi:hypothetical protein